MKKNSCHHRRGSRRARTLREASEASALPLPPHHYLLKPKSAPPRQTLNPRHSLMRNTVALSRARVMSWRSAAIRTPRMSSVAQVNAALDISLARN